MEIHPITLTGQIVRLEPLSQAHVPALAKAGHDESIWRYMVYGQLITEEKMRAWVISMLNKQEDSSDLPFAVVHLETQQAIGATRYLEISSSNRSVEIGGTWYSVIFQRTGVNTECKYLLLKYAFEELDCVRVQLKTDLRNIRSQRALERIGAKKEGVLRNHMILPDGYVRDSVVYSIIDSEWPVVKGDLEEKMHSYG